MRQPEKTFFDLPAADLVEIVRGAENEWRELQGRRFFITGGTGFFGKWILAALAAADHEWSLNLDIAVLSRDPSHFVERHPEAARFRFHRGEIVGFRLPDERYDFIIHAATDTTAITTPPEEEMRSRSIVDGTDRMLGLARQSHARRLLNISSGAVYGAAAGKREGAREEDYVDAVPLTPYARAKRRAEELCAESGIDFVTARAFAFMGPHLPLDAHYAAGNFLRDAAKGGPIMVRGDGTALRSYLYPTDLVGWLLRLLLRGEAGRAYNVGSDEAVSTGALARRIAAACPGSPEVMIQSVQPEGPQNIYLPDVSRARTELGLEVQVKLDDAIRRSLAWIGPR